MSAVIDTGHAGRPPAPSPMALGEEARAIVFDATGERSLARFHAEVRALAARLPDGRHVINLCEDRYRFLVAFCAAALRGQTTLLPPSRAPRVVDEVLAQHPDACCLGDVPLAPEPPRYLRLPDPLPQCDGPPPRLADDALVAIGFTSGSGSGRRR